MIKYEGKLLSREERKGGVCLYEPSREKDSCGIGLVAHIRNRVSHDIVRQGIGLLCNLTHRGAVGANPDEGDGVGMLTHIPDLLLRATCPQDKQLPPQGDYGVVMMFLSFEDNLAKKVMALVEECAQKRGMECLYWREPPLSPDKIGSIHAPIIKQAVLASTHKGDDFERALYLLRKEVEHHIASWGAEDVHIASASSRTIVYKGMMLAQAFVPFYGDLQDARYHSAVAMVHQRFSTNTFPSWSLAQPFHLLCHNGEINTWSGNMHWMRARGSQLSVPFCAKKDEKILQPLFGKGLSDSACLDEALDLLLKGGYSLPHAMMMLIPNVWENGALDKEWEAFCAYHALKMEAWDGPAAVAFCDGRFMGAMLDRNGLRPARYHVTEDDVLLLASEAGCLALDEEKIIKKGRLAPGKMLLLDLAQQTLIEDGDIKTDLARKDAWRKKYDQKVHFLAEGKTEKKERQDLTVMHSYFGYTKEDFSFYLTDMARTGGEPIGSMGSDTPPAALSRREPLLYDYFKQRFAQVTNPAIDPIRESLVMSLKTFLGARLPLFEEMDKERIIFLESPFLDGAQMAALEREAGVVTLEMLYDLQDKNGFKKSLRDLRVQAEHAIQKQKARILILSDRHVSQTRAPLASLLALGAVHHHLVRKGLRTKVGLVVASGECRQPHHMALLAGYGADAIHPWLALESVAHLTQDKNAQKNYMKALQKSLLKIMSKMGISTYRSYCGAQLFDAVGLSHELIDEFFTETPSYLSGIGLEVLAQESARRHRRASGVLEAGGDYAYRVRGEAHAWTPETVAHLQHSVRGKNAIDDEYRAFAQKVNEEQVQRFALRSMMTFKDNAIPLEQVEKNNVIMRRFATGAMSFGSISREAHTTLALAMNKVGGKSNTGEGGEEEERFKPLANGDSMRSAIKQVASGRFGVTAHYLVNGDDIQIKICQGAKPGEGGQLPAHKVDEVIARVRHSIPAVGLISPPPHHDIYSIEDLAQLIFDLKNVNPAARISVKLASEVGVGVVAAGVVKARADHVTIAGYEGGTGASPLTSIKHTGLPWELGLAETHQTLVLHRLRDRVCLQVDGGFRTGRDVVIGALLGADEFGFATAPLITLGCLMMRKCHLNTCPVGIATQDKILRQRFTGKAEHVIRYFHYVSEEVREWMALLGVRSFDEMVGRSDLLLAKKALSADKASALDLKRLLHFVKPAQDDKLYCAKKQDHPIKDILDKRLIKSARAVLTQAARVVSIACDIKNTDRAAGAMLSGEVARLFGAQGLRDDSISISLKGTAGQSFGAFVTKGISLTLEGEANDYVGKGLCGGRIVIMPHDKAKHILKESHRHMILGNTSLYGATSGELYASGMAGERFAVRNSGAIAVVEGTGDHPCEYMTGGIVVILGDIGVNMAAGMSGGIAYVFDEHQTLAHHCNGEMVRIQPLIQQEFKTEGNLVISGEQLKKDPLTNDVWRLHHLIRNHQRYTNSARARFILENWQSSLSHFRKIIPHDFERALSKSDESMIHSSVGRL